MNEIEMVLSVLKVNFWKFSLVMKFPATQRIFATSIAHYATLTALKGSNVSDNFKKSLHIQRGSVLLRSMWCILSLPNSYNKRVKHAACKLEQLHLWKVEQATFPPEQVM